MTSESMAWAFLSSDAIVEAIHEPLVVLDGSLRVKRANQSFYRTFLISPEEAEGREFYELSDRGWDSPSLRELLEQVLPQHSFRDNFATAHHFPVIGHKMMLVNAREFSRNGGGSSNCILLAIEDISEREEAERARKAAETRLSLLLDHVQDHAVFTLDAEGRVALWSSAARNVLGYEEEEALGKRFSDFFLDVDIESDGGRYDREEAARILQVAAETGRGETEGRRIRKGGRQIKTQEVVTPILDEGSGRTAGFLVILHDVTKAKDAEEKLRQQAEALKDSDRRKDDFLIVLAHELRNPLAPIRNAVQIMRMAEHDSAIVEQARQIIDRQVQQMSRVVEDLLDVSRIIMGQIFLKKERIELSSVIAAAVDASRSLIDVSNHRLTVRLPTEPVILEGDRIRLVQVIVNLLSNAAKFTANGGFIWLVAEIVEDRVEIHVRDNGIGINPAMLTRVFDMFAQADSTIERAQGGLGVGLTVARSLVEMHGGTVCAVSPGPGQGTEFIVSLPLAQHDPEPRRYRPPSLDNSARGAAEVRKILVVDDNIDSAASLATVLRLKGWEARTAFDGPHAVEAAKAFLPDAILLDIGLPGMSGYEVARAIRQNPVLKNVLLIAQTGWGQEENRLRSQEAGFDHHLVKPVELPILEALLSRLDQPRDAAS